MCSTQLVITVIKIPTKNHLGEEKFIWVQDLTWPTPLLWAPGKSITQGGALPSHGSQEHQERGRGGSGQRRTALPEHHPVTHPIQPHPTGLHYHPASPSKLGWTVWLQISGSPNISAFRAFGGHHHTMGSHTTVCDSEILGEKTF